MLLLIIPMILLQSTVIGLRWFIRIISVLKYKIILWFYQCKGELPQLFTYIVGFKIYWYFYSLIFKGKVIYAYKEIITVDNLQQLTLSKPLNLPIGKKVEVLVIAEDDGESLDDIRALIKQQAITESMINEAIEWARK